MCPLEANEDFGARNFMEGAGGVELSPLFPQLVGLRVHIYSTIIDFGSLEFNGSRWMVEPSAVFPQLLGLRVRVLVSRTMNYWE